MAVLGRGAWLLLILAVAGGCRSGEAQWGPFRGQVVDAETGMPIAGAYVMVTWERDSPNLAHWTQSFYDAQETMTDANGRFEIPHRRRLLTALVSEPRISAFASARLPETEEVTPIGERPYVEPTILKMRYLETREERCKHTPGSPGIAASRQAPRFAEAVYEYVTGLDCHLPEGR